LAFSGKDVVREVVETGGLPRRTMYSITEVPRLVSDLKAIRQNGVAVEREESTIGTVGLAAPILSEGHVVAAVGVTMPAPISNTARTSALVRAAAQAISRDHEAWAKEIW
jgi:DNA-binding IclR family transcriptional regulator